jgi:hypothetical protein
MAQRAELGVKENDHQPEDQAEARFGALFALELPAPFQGGRAADETLVVATAFLASASSTGKLRFWKLNFTIR